MRIVTWNCCRGAYAKNSALLEGLAPDVAVIQECAKPERESEHCLWFGENARQGIAVQVAPPYRVVALPRRRNVPKFVVPAFVTGPRKFNLLALWAKAN